MGYILREGCDRFKKSAGTNLKRKMGYIWGEGSDRFKN